MTTTSSKIVFAKDLKVGDKILLDSLERVILEIKPFEVERSLYLRFEEKNVIDSLKASNGHFFAKYDGVEVLN